ncbi:hypothetical protein GOB27_14455 [Sinorhizobium meliloti]|nr:hypothetical protein [Sinorhizobium meliloti]
MTVEDRSRIYDIIRGVHGPSKVLFAYLELETANVYLKTRKSEDNGNGRERQIERPAELVADCEHDGLLPCEPAEWRTAGSKGVKAPSLGFACGWKKAA